MRAPIDARLGKPELAFADPAAFGWALFALGAALFVAGAILLLLFLFALPPHHHRSGDDWTLFGFGAVLALGGLSGLWFATRDMRGKPVWQLCEHGMVWQIGGRSTRLTYWSDIPKLEIVQRVRGRNIVGYYLRGAPRLVFVPNRAVAERAFELWQMKQPIAMARPA